MGKLAILVNDTLDKIKAAGIEIEADKVVQSEKDRHDLLERMTKSAKSVTVYANKAFSTWYIDENIKINKGENSVPPSFAIHLLLKYGVNNNYGVLAKMNDTWINDEPFEKAVRAKTEKTDA